MRFCRLLHDGVPCLGVSLGEKVALVADIYKLAGTEPPREVQSADLIGVAARWKDFVAEIGRLVSSLGDSGSIAQLRQHDAERVFFLAPIPRPGKFICVGLNYRDHCDEQNVEIPKSPVIFAKFANAVCGHRAVVRRPAITRKLDFEGELGVVIGKTGKRIRAENALDYVFGYTIVNDVSAREIQKQDGQWLRAKSMDGFAPTGPWITTADEIRDPQQLKIRTEVNGRVMQESSTSRMIFPVASLIEFISQGITLEPGDVISTGTPAGVGVWRRPPVFLEPGDIVRIEIDGIGCLENSIADEES